MKEIDNAQIIDNYINGNKQVFREAIDDLTRSELIHLAQYWRNYQATATTEILKIIYTSLLIIEQGENDPTK